MVINCPLNDPARLNEAPADAPRQGLHEGSGRDVPAAQREHRAREVLLGLPGLTETEVDAMICARDGPDSRRPGDDLRRLARHLRRNLTPRSSRRWSSTSPATSMVYRIESIGYLAGGSPVVRIEAVIDINLGSPRILYYRELTDLDSPRAFQPPK